MKSALAAPRLGALLLALALWSGAARPGLAGTQTPDSFAARVAALSEPGGYFNTDNLISNERSYLHVAPELRALARRGTAGSTYLGVGPDQNFSYIAQSRPALAIIIDIRRDNLLLHLLFKALFAEARTRIDYAALLTGRPMPADPTWAARPIDAIVKYIDDARPLPEDRLAALRTRLARAIRSFGVPLTDADLATIDGFHRRFIDAGLSLQFNTTGRGPQIDYPTYEDLLLERDLNGVRAGFLASEDDFQFVKGLEARDLVIPIVGDLAGPTAIRRVGQLLTQTHHTLAAFYTSNVEFYLFRDGTFPAFVANLSALPRQSDALIVRSIFRSGGTSVALRPGYNSASVTQPVHTLLDGYAKGRFRQYADLIAARGSGGIGGSTLDLSIDRHTFDVGVRALRGRADVEVGQVR